LPLLHGGKCACDNKSDSSETQAQCLPKVVLALKFKRYIIAALFSFLFFACSFISSEISDRDYFE